MLVSGWLDPARREAARKGEKPRVDMFEVSALLDAQIYDYHWFTERAKREPLTGLMLWLANHLGFWHVWLTLRTFWSTHASSVVYATGEDVGIALAIVLRLLNRRSPRLVMRLEEPVYGRTRLRRAVVRALMRFGLPRVNLVLCRTHAHIERLQHELAVPPDAVRFLPETVDTSYYATDPSSASVGAVEPPGQPYILSAGLEMRDYATLVEAVRGLPVQVLIAADSPWSHESFSMQAELPPNVRVAAFNQLQLRELYRSASLVVVSLKPTERSCGISVALEALAMGRPLIASATEGLGSYLQDGVTASLVVPGDQELMRERILALLADPAEARRLAAQGQAHVAQGLHLESFVESVCALLLAPGAESPAGATGASARRYSEATVD